MPGSQRLARLFGADVPGDAHFHGLVGNAQQFPTGLAQPRLGGGSHDGDNILKASAGTVGHLLRIGENLPHDLFRRVHDLAQIGEGILGADGQFDRQGHCGPGDGGARQTGMQVGPLGAQGFGLASIGGKGGLHLAGVINFCGQRAVILGQTAHAAAHGGRLGRGGAPLSQLAVKRAGEARDALLRQLYLPGQHAGSAAGGQRLGIERGKRAPGFLETAGKASDFLPLGQHGRAQLAHGRFFHFADGLRDAARL